LGNGVREIALFLPALLEIATFGKARSATSTLTLFDTLLHGIVEFESEQLVASEEVGDLSDLALNRVDHTIAMEERGSKLLVQTCPESLVDRLGIDPKVENRLSEQNIDQIVQRGSKVQGKAPQ